MESTDPNMFPSEAAETTEPPHIATIDELMKSHESLVVKEAQDRASLNVLLNPTRDTFRGPLFQWASASFEYGFMIFSLSIDVPPMCSDGQVRATGGYIQYLTGKSHEEIAAGIQLMLTGIQVFTNCTNTAIEVRVIKI
jgi:hypothetical protein